MRTVSGRTISSVIATALAAVLVALSISTVSVASAGETVTIVRDSRGEPHIRGQSAASALYGFGYAQMEDQATYILSTIATSTGRSAELLGPGCLPLCFLSDQLVHLYRLPESSYGKYSSLPADTRMRLRAFADGINAFIDANRARVPAWAAHVTPQDVLASVQFRFLLAQASDAEVGGSNESAGTAPGGDASTFDGVAHMPGIAPDMPASNGFVLAGSKTASGKPMVEGNPHLPYDGASRWYAAQLSYPGTRVEGATFRGLPGIAIGSNGDVAWTHTANHVTQNETDRYTETLNPANPNQYLYGDSYADMTVRQVPIKVQTAPGSVTSVNVTLRYTVHGPVVSDPPASTNGTQAQPAGGTATSATVSQFEQVGLATQLYAEAESHNLTEYRAALSQDQLSGFNILAADESDIFYAGGSRSGILNPGLNPNQPLDGSNPYTTWQGILPFEQLPQASNPPSGYYQNANNAAQFSAPGQITLLGMPYYLRGTTNGTRSRRQVQLLDPLSNATLSNLEQIGNDHYLELAPALKELLAQTAAAPGADPKVVEANTLIQGWDNQMEMNSTEYPLFATWVRGINENAAGIDVANPPPVGTTYTSAAKTEASRAMIVAYNGMKAQYGAIAIRYGDLHRYTYGSLDAAVNGGDTTLPALKMTNCKGQPSSESPVYYHLCNVRGGSSFMFNVNLATDRFTVQRPVPDTDNPASPFYTLNAQDYVNDTYRDFPVTDAAADAQQTSRLDLTLPARPSLGLSTAALGFGDRLVGSGPTTQTLTVRNNGVTDAYVNAVALGGTNTDAFALAGDSCTSRTLEAGQACSVGVSFVADTVGARSATLTVASDATPSEATSALSGKVVRPDATLRIHSRNVVVDRHGRFHVSVSCRPDGVKKCAGRVEVLANRGVFKAPAGRRTAKLAGKTTQRRIAKTQYSVAKGNRMVRSHLRGYGLRALRRHGSMHAKLVVTVKRPHQRSRQIRAGIVLRLRRH